MRVTIGIILLFLMGISICQGERLYWETTSLPESRQMHGAVVMGDYMYVLGGNHPVKGYSTGVFVAPIQSNGHLGPWRQTTPLPEKTSYVENSTLVLNDIVYVVGGLNGENVTCSNYILWTRPRQDGTLEPWRRSAPYQSQGVHCAVAVATPGYIHLIGGLRSDDTPTERVWSARIHTTQGITGWEGGQSLPTKLWYHCGEVSGGKVWVWGGLTTRQDNSVNNFIYYAPILSSGKLGPWQKYPSTIPAGFYASSSTVTGSHLISFCPRYSGRTPSNDIWYTSVSPDGLSEWIKYPTNFPSKMYIGLATDYRRGVVYIPGGRNNDQQKLNVNSNVFLFKLRQSTKERAGTDVAQTIDTQTRGSGASHYSYMQYTGQASGNIPGFMSYEGARNLYDKPMLIYFHNIRALNCQKQNDILSKIDVSQYQDKITFSEIDTIQYPQFSQQYGVFRVPCWMYFDKQGRSAHRKYGILQLGELQSVIDNIISTQ